MSQLLRDKVRTELKAQQQQNLEELGNAVTEPLEMAKKVGINLGLGRALEALDQVYKDLQG